MYLVMHANNWNLFLDKLSCLNTSKVFNIWKDFLDYVQGHMQNWIPVDEASKKYVIHLNSFLASCDSFSADNHCKQLDPNSLTPW